MVVSGFVVAAAVAILVLAAAAAVLVLAALVVRNVVFLVVLVVLIHLAVVLLVVVLVVVIAFAVAGCCVVCDIVVFLAVVLPVLPTVPSDGFERVCQHFRPPFAVSSLSKWHCVAEYVGGAEHSVTADIKDLLIYMAQVYFISKRLALRCTW